MSQEKDLDKIRDMRATEYATTYFEMGWTDIEQVDPDSDPQPSFNEEEAAAFAAGWNKALESILSTDLISEKYKLREQVKILKLQNNVMASALEWYGYKMVPDSINAGKELITTELGARARASLAVGNPNPTAESEG